MPITKEYLEKRRASLAERQAQIIQQAQQLQAQATGYQGAIADCQALLDELAKEEAPARADDWELVAEGPVGEGLEEAVAQAADYLDETIPSEVNPNG